MEQIRRMPSGPPHERRASFVAQTLKETVQGAFVRITNIGIAAGRGAEFTSVAG